ncbi:MULTISPECIES: S1C family serine protease [unclassified Agromyces]|uniref:S1C family serine protease n=1 Tax=unclassified Agromyces TaxID=2639701 RepID=UPI003014F5BF
MTDTTPGGHEHHPEPRPQDEPQAPAAGTPQASEAPRATAQPAEPAEPAEPAVPTAPAAMEADSAPRPTGTVYTPGQAPQPYVAPQYRHEPATAPAPGATAPTTPLTAAAAGAAAASAAHPAPIAGRTDDGGGSVPPAFGGPAPAASASPQGPQKRRAGFGVAAAVVAAALIGGASGAGITALMTNDGDETVLESTSGERIVINDTESVNQISAVAASASPSVVTIAVSGGQGQGTGSGVVLSEDGYVLTNTHVVTLDGATGDPSIQVRTDDGRLYSAELIGTDPLSDLAVIKLVDASGLQAIEFADSDELNVGDTAIAIGAPLGLSGTVTNGIVSALNRSIDVQSAAAPETPDDGSGEDGGEGEGEGESPFDFWNFDVPGQEGGQSQGSGLISIPVIQTDAAINPGNSGGALLDSEGRLIGVNVAILSAGGASGEAGNIGVGFAVPANLAQRVANEIIEDGAATHGLLGATVTSAQAAGEGSTVGALISEVSPGGAAESAGLESGDVVTALNGIPITDQTDLTAQVRALPGGAEAEVTYTRDGESRTVDVTLGTFEG